MYSEDGRAGGRTRGVELNYLSLLRDGRARAHSAGFCLGGGGGGARRMLFARRRRAINWSARSALPLQLRLGLDEDEQQEQEWARKRAGGRVGEVGKGVEEAKGAAAEWKEIGRPPNKWPAREMSRFHLAR